ncbi:MAG: hypothetical protein CL920_17625 [Deltaproteobacteria bacterium]|nr:hypothetical protein [Deltaproteobacteria bacterium]MBU50499.1 hypothetical protein [Deltaproteobacteria bacterium]
MSIFSRRLYAKTAAISLVMICFLMCLSACPGPPEECVSKSDCEQQYFCVDGKCTLPDVYVQPEPSDEKTVDDVPEKTPELPPKETVEEKEAQVETVVDESGPCKAGSRRLCYTGPPETRNVGACRSGKQTCKSDGTWTTCLGELKPKDEVCNGKDDNCDGTVDETNECDACSACKSGGCVVKEDAVPVLNSLSVVSLTGNALNSVTAKGQCFSAQAKLVFDSNSVTTKIVSSNELQGEVDTKGIAPGKYDVIVSNGQGKDSKPIEVEVQQASCLSRPFFGTMNTNNGEAGKQIPFTITGFSLQQKTSIIFDGKAIPTKFINTSSLEADPRLDLTNVKAGVYEVWLRNPDFCESTKMKFYVLDPNATPLISNVTPGTVSFNKATTVEIRGNNFVQGANVFVGLQSLPGVIYRSPVLLEVPLTLTAKNDSSGDFSLSVLNPNGNRSNSMPIKYRNGLPTIISTTPSMWNTKCSKDIVVQGTGFERGVSLTFGTTKYTTGGATHPLTRTSDVALSFSLDHTTLQKQDYTITVSNGTFGTSKPYTFKVIDGTSLAASIGNVQPPSGKAGQTVNVTVTPKAGTDFYSGAVVELDGKPQITSCVQPGPGQPCSSLSVILDLSGIAAGTANLVVVNPCQSKSAATSFTVTP